MQSLSSVMQKHPIPTMRLKSLRMEKGECPLHGPFEGYRFYQPDGSPIHDLVCPVCLQQSERQELQHRSSSMPEQAVTALALEAGLGRLQITQGLQVISPNLLSKQHQHFLLRLANQPNFHGHSIQIRLSGATSDDRTLVGASFLINSIRKAEQLQKPASVLYLPLDLADVVYNPYKAQEFLEQWSRPRILFIDYFAYLDKRPEFQKFLPILLRIRSINSKVTLLSKETFDQQDCAFLDNQQVTPYSIELQRDADA